MEGVSVFGREGTQQLAPNLGDPPYYSLGENLSAASMDPQIEQIDEAIFNKISNQFLLLLLLLLLLSVAFGFLFCPALYNTIWAFDIL